MSFRPEGRRDGPADLARSTAEGVSGFDANVGSQFPLYAAKEADEHMATRAYAAYELIGELTQSIPPATYLAIWSDPDLAIAKAKASQDHGI